MSPTIPSDALFRSFNLGVITCCSPNPRDKFEPSDTPRVVVTARRRHPPLAHQQCGKHTVTTHPVSKSNSGVLIKWFCALLSSTHCVEVSSTASSLGFCRPFPLDADTGMQPSVSMSRLLHNALLFRVARAPPSLFCLSRALLLHQDPHHCDAFPHTQTSLRAASSSSDFTDVIRLLSSPSTDSSCVSRQHTRCRALERVELFCFPVMHSRHCCRVVV